MLNKSVMVFLSLFLHIIGDLFHSDILSKVIIINISLHLNKVNNSLEGVFRAYRKLNRNCVCVKSCVHHVNNAIEVSAHNVHLIYISHTGNMILVSLTPNCFRLRFNTALSAENCYRTVEYTK